MSLRGTQRTSKLNIDSLNIDFNDIALVFDERCSDTFGGLPY